MKIELNEKTNTLQKIIWLDPYRDDWGELITDGKEVFGWANLEEGYYALRGNNG